MTDSYLSTKLRVVPAVVWMFNALVIIGSCSKPAETSRVFKAPEEAVKALDAAVKKSSVEDIVALFGEDGKMLVDTADPIAARQGREVFATALAEGWRLVEEGDHTVLIVGNEGWPFPIPLVKDTGGWRFDTEAGKEEVIARRIGRNELKVIQICNTYVAAQHAYAADKHDGKPAGLYARVFRSEAGKQNGLYWPAARGEKRSPLGDLIPAAEERAAAATSGKPQPFHGYYFKILTTQGAAAPGGAKDYVVNGDLSGGFALVAWPAEYDVTGIMTFLVNQEGVVHEKDLGKDTEATVTRMTAYDPDSSWMVAQ
jgi:hypothetical protein